LTLQFGQTIEVSSFEYLMTWKHFGQRLNWVCFVLAVSIIPPLRESIIGIENTHLKSETVTRQVFSKIVRKKFLFPDQGFTDSDDFGSGKLVEWRFRIGGETVAIELLVNRVEK